MAHAHSHTTAGQRHRGRLAAALAITVTVLVVEVVGAAVSPGRSRCSPTPGTCSPTLPGCRSRSRRPARCPPCRSSPARSGGSAPRCSPRCVNGCRAAGRGGAGDRRGRAAPGSAGSGRGRPGMLAFGALGLVANAVGAAAAAVRPPREHSTCAAPTSRCSATCSGSVAVIAAAVVDRPHRVDLRADAVASLAIGLMILPRALALLRDVGHGAARGDAGGLSISPRCAAHPGDVDGVVAVHDLHAWTITSGVPVLTAHVVVDDAARRRRAAATCSMRCSDCLPGHFDVEHSTFQIEPSSHDAHDEAAAHG